MAVYRLAWPRGHDVIGEAMYQLVRPVHPVARQCHHNDRNTKQPNKCRYLDRDVDDDGLGLRPRHPVGDRAHPGAESWVVVRGPVQGTVRRWFGCRVLVITR